VELRPSLEANRFESSQEIPTILWNRDVYSRIHNSPPNFRILSEVDPVHNTTYQFMKIHFIIIIPFSLRLHSDVLIRVFTTKIQYKTFGPPYALNAPLISFFPILLTANFGWAIQNIKLLIIQGLPFRFTQAETEFSNIIFFLVF